MAYEFEFIGGAVKPTEHSIEKLFVFFVVAGKEVPFFQMLRDGLILQKAESKHTFVTGNNVMKVFIAQQGFGIQRKFHSFYVKFRDGAGPMITIKSFSGDQTKLRISGKFSFLKKSEVLAILDSDNESRRFVKRQRTLPVDVLYRLITVDKSEMKKGIRHVRIGKGNKGQVSSNLS